MLLEFAVNDGHGNKGSLSSVETILRRVTYQRGGYSARPAIALVNWWDRWPGREDGPEARGRSRAEWTPKGYDVSFETVTSSLAHYYDVPSLSLRDALMQIDLQRVAGFSFEDFSENWVHPNARGHRMMADAVIHLIAKVADGVLHERAVSRLAELHARHKHVRSVAQLPPPPPPGGDPLWLPPPLVDGNDSEAREPVCRLGDELHALVTRADGFTYVADAEKPGWMANTSGAVLELAVGPTHGGVILSHLRSWRPGMGEGRVTCVTGGCACDLQRLDGRINDNVSIMVQHPFAVSAAPNCTLRIEAVTQPPLVGSKGAAGAAFKVMGVVVTGLGVAPRTGMVRLSSCVTTLDTECIFVLVCF